MVLLLRSCILNGKKLFIQEVMSFKRTFTYSTYNSVEKVTSIVQRRHFFTKNVEDTENELIYKGRLGGYVRKVKMFSIVSSLISLMSQPILYIKLMENADTISSAMVLTGVNVFSIVSPFIINLISKRYVLSIYYCPQENNYIAYVYAFFCNKKKITFTLNDVTEPKSTNAMFTTCYVRDYPLFFDEDYFLNPEHYFIIMGYNKPTDFKVKKLEVTAINQAPVIEPSHQIESKVKDEK